MAQTIGSPVVINRLLRTSDWRNTGRGLARLKCFWELVSSVTLVRRLVVFFAFVHKSCPGQGKSHSIERQKLEPLSLCELFRFRVDALKRCRDSFFKLLQPIGLE